MDIGKKDKDWVRRSFLVSARAITDQDLFRREITDAAFKFTDTTLGGNFAINPPPQFSRNADIKVPSRFTDGAGMGRYYSESLDDHGQLIHMRFGVPQYNSLTNFFFNFYDTNTASLANKGKVPDSVFYDAGKVLGYIVSIPAMPIVWIGKVVDFLENKSSSKFYYLKPAMPLYWSAVTTMTNAIGVNMGLVGRRMSKAEKAIRTESDPAVGVKGNDESSELHRIMSKSGAGTPTIYSDVWREDGGVDIYAMATRAQRMAATNRKAIQKVLESDGTWEQLNAELHAKLTDPVADTMPKTTFNDYIKTYHNGKSGTIGKGEGGNYDAEEVGENFEGIGKESGFKDHLLAELEDGSQFVTFRVDDVGTVGESFSNSTGESSLASSLNSKSSAGRSTRFNLADGNFGNGLIGGTLTAIADAAKSFVQGVGDGLEIQGIAAFTGTAFADIPNVWQGSSASLPKSTYNIELRSPYGNPMSRFQNLIVPLSMLLAGALPLSTGKQSYTSPFLVELYSKGRNQTRLGMIDSISITRGVGNLGWTKDGEPLGIDVSFSVIDLSTILHVPITSNFDATDVVTVGAASAAGAGMDSTAGVLGWSTGSKFQDGAEDLVNTLASANFDDDNTFTDYMAVLGGLSLSDQIYPINKLRLKRLKRAAAWESWKSPAYHANWMVGTSLGQAASAIVTSSINSRNR